MRKETQDSTRERGDLFNPQHVRIKDMMGIFEGFSEEKFEASSPSKPDEYKQGTQEPQKNKDRRPTTPYMRSAI